MAPPLSFLAASASLLAAAVPSRGSSARVHRAGGAATLGLILIFAACAVPAIAAYPDEQIMGVVAKALGADHALGWTNNTSPCVDGWIGVVCDQVGRVTAIYARNTGLNGTLPPDIGGLAALHELDLRDNSIRGELPNQYFLDLMRLRLDGNNFTSIPTGFLRFGTSLQIFTISNSSHLQSWELPRGPYGPLGFETTLQVYIADNAHLAGNLSLFLGSNNSFNSLNVLSLANNNLTGEVRATFASRTLTQLDLSHNMLTGPVSFLGNLRELEEIRLNGNGFTGPLPDFSGHWSLTLVDLAHNRLTGVVPASLVQLGGLRSVSIKHNLFQGAVPEFAGSVLTDIAEAASNESFCRPQPGPCDRRVQSFIAIAGGFRFPEDLAASWKGNDPCDRWLGIYCNKNGEITGVNFGHLKFNGTLHPAFGDLKSLMMIIVAGNNLTGTVPPSIAALPSLRIIDVSDNSLSGTMPTFRSGVMIWAGGNKNLTVAGASRLCITDPMRRFAAAAAAAIVVLVLA
ncbi:receptor protein kinase TMK1-like [Lolium perenne]|uniref:receptor protein kinase TMK1-like n=1 Tax=Lolium perenne TaxID=4522 RepID=UPI0021F5EEC5|nr:receptor protein kinase TMK1-like [Lolium perenne]